MHQSAVEEMPLAITTKTELSFVRIWVHRMSWVYLLKNNSETWENFKKFIALVEKQSGCYMKILRSNKGGNLPPMSLIFSMRKMVFVGSW